jgi:8-amino-7-oxononanoate synthase
VTRRNPASAQETVDRVRSALDQSTSSRPGNRPATGTTTGDGQAFDFNTLPEYEIHKLTKAAGAITGIQNPWYKVHDGRAGETTSIAGRTVVNFSSYDYLGLNGHPAVDAAAKAAIDRFGTSVSASRLSAGERQIHRDLEAALARLHGTEDAVVFVGGHATNVTVIGHLLGPEDLIVTDAVSHNSVFEGAKLSGAKHIQCAHGDIDAMERILRLNRARHRRALIVVEGLYSMDGDAPDLAALIRLKRRYSAWLMVDEAHSAGVLGVTGRGIAEEQGVDPAAVAIWMGTLSKSFASTGGYIAGSRPLVDLIKSESPGFIYSVGLSPPNTAAALAAVEMMRDETWRLDKLRQNGRLFLARAKAHGLDTGLSMGAAIIPVIVGSSPHAVILTERLLARGYNVAPAIFPGVAENQARLRFFMTSRHMPEQIESVLETVADELPKVRSGPSLVDIIARR